MYEMRFDYNLKYYDSSDYYPHLYLFRLQEGSRVRKEIAEEGRRAHRPKRCIDMNKDEDNSSKNRYTTEVNMP